MKVDKAWYASTAGSLHCVFFMGLVGTAFDYPGRAINNIGAWDKRQSTFGTIDQSHDVEAIS